MPLTDDDVRFLQAPRLGFVTVYAGQRPPPPVPVWFDADHDGVQLFSSAGSPKVQRCRRADGASLVAANALGEPEHWVAVSGAVTVADDGGFELASRLAERYWDMSDPGHLAALEGWRTADLVRISIRADRVRRYG